MTTHFPTVPVDGAFRAAHVSSSNPPRPLALIVDDDPMITGTLAAILSGSGIAALTASDGLRALETARVIPPEILISDLAIPGMTGLDLALEITRAAQDCDVILFASHGVTAQLAAKMQRVNCAFSVLIKPVHPADLLESVFRLLARRGHSLVSPRICRSPAFYDFLASARYPAETYSETCNVRHRQRIRSTILPA